MEDGGIKLMDCNKLDIVIEKSYQLMKEKHYVKNSEAKSNQLILMTPQSEDKVKRNSGYLDFNIFTKLLIFILSTSVHVSALHCHLPCIIANSSPALT